MNLAELERIISEFKKRFPDAPEIRWSKYAPDGITVMAASVMDTPFAAEKTEGKIWLVNPEWLDRAFLKSCGIQP